MTIWLPTIKSRESPQFIWMQMACYILLGSSRQGINFVSDLTSIRGLHTKLWASKVVGVQILGVSGQNDIWVWVAWPNIKYTIKGKVVASPKSGPWWILWLCVCTWLVRAQKVFQLRINQLVVWFVQVYVSN